MTVQFNTFAPQTTKTRFQYCDEDSGQGGKAGDGKVNVKEIKAGLAAATKAGDTESITAYNKELDHLKGKDDNYCITEDQFNKWA